jgi:F-type H+-transporting ATPase subunit a
MEKLEHSLAVVELFNRAFGKPLAAALGLVGIQVKDPAHLVPDHVVMSLIVVLGLCLTLALLARRLTLVPSKRQSVLELIVGTFEGLATDFIGEAGRRYVPLIGSVGLFVLTANLLGLVPGLMSPTSKITVTAGCALVVFVFYHAQGFRAHGLGYLKQFMGPVPFLAPLMFPIEIISHFSRPVSLSMRLFGNIFSEELLILIMFSILPFVLPLPFMAIAMFTAVIQAFVFVLLSCIYIAGAIAEEH